MSSCSGSVWELRGASRPAAAFLQPAFPSSVGGCQAITLPPPSLAGWSCWLPGMAGWISCDSLSSGFVLSTPAESEGHAPSLPPFGKTRWTDDVLTSHPMTSFELGLGGPPSK